MTPLAYLLAALTAAVPSPPPTALCQALEFTMSESGTPDLDLPAQRVLRRFFRSSVVESNTARLALADPRVRVAIVAPYGAMHGFEQNRGLTRRRGEAIRDYIVESSVAPERIDIVELTDSMSYLARAEVPRGTERWPLAYVLFEYPLPVLPESSAAARSPYCGDIFSR